MKSVLSGLVAETIMQHPETIALSHVQPKLWILYVGNTFVIIKRNNKKRHVKLSISSQK